MILESILRKWYPNTKESYSCILLYWWYCLVHRNTIFLISLRFAEIANPHHGIVEILIVASICCHCFACVTSIWVVSHGVYNVPPTHFCVVAKHCFLLVSMFPEGRKTASRNPYVNNSSACFGSNSPTWFLIINFAQGLQGFGHWSTNCFQRIAFRAISLFLPEVHLL